MVEDLLSIIPEGMESRNRRESFEVEIK